MTRWSLVSRARGPEDSPARREALEELCHLYWFPLYAFARQKGNTPEDAEDATQGFFLEILEAELFSEADPVRGKLRTFLLFAFQRFLIDAHRFSKAAKRGGGFDRVLLDVEAAEERYQAEKLSGASPEVMFDREWALTILEKALNTLCDQYKTAGKEALLEELRPFLDLEAESPGRYDQLCFRTSMTKSAARQAVHRLRDRFRELLRGMVADTLRDASEAAIDEELASLQKILTN